MTPARPELAAHERTAALQQQTDLARLARFPAVPLAGPKPSREEAAARTSAQVEEVCRTNPDWQAIWSQAMNQVPTPRREARTPPRRQLRVTRRQHRRRLPSPVDRRTPAGRLLPY